MNKKYLLREYYALCDGGTCQDLLTEEEKRQVREEKVVFLTGKLQEADCQMVTAAYTQDQYYKGKSKTTRSWYRKIEHWEN